MHDVWSSCATLNRDRDLLAGLTPPYLEAARYAWNIHVLPHQVAPVSGRDGTPWTIWLIMAGRGAGKTRAGAEWVRALACGLHPFARRVHGRIALVGETFAAARDVMIEGPSGLLAVHPRRERPDWSPSLRKLAWRSGAVAHVFSAEDPDSLRGPQFAAAWADELAKWPRVEETWDMLQFGLRLGQRPRVVVTTTPRPIPLIKRLVDDPRVAVSRAATHANAKNLAPSFLDSVVGRYAGTRLGRQEIDGDIVEERADALWTRDTLEACRVAAAPPLARVVVAVDPPISARRGADSCGIVAAGVGADGIGYVLANATVAEVKPPVWAARAVALYRRLEADALVVEVNQGGDMAAAVIREVDPGVPVTAVRATRGKYVRAEPVATLYEQGRVHHVGAYPALEDELCDFGPGGLASGRSPDRLDALVWALTHLMLQRAEPRVRML